jgi:intracellular sulfur oxidation DsrE/DsrF family protein
MVVRHWLLIAVIAALGGTGIAIYALKSAPPAGRPPAPMAAVRLVQPNPEVAESRYVLDISVHTPDEIESVLKRVEELAATMPSAPSGGAPIALVLHGPEIEFFTRQNLATYRNLVNETAALDARGLIEVKMCETKMRELGVSARDVPPFVELVPYGPDEVERLKRHGYVQM